VIIEPVLNRGAWNLVDTLTNLRADARTAALPVFAVGPVRLSERLASYPERFPRLAFLAETNDPNLLRRQLDRELGRMGVRPLSEDERPAYAQAAAALLARVAQEPGSPFESTVVEAAPALEVALGNPATALAASSALGDVPSIDAQRSLADVVLDPSRPGDVRLNAAAQLTRSLQRFGRLIS